jgi:predicted helicase
VSNRGQAYLFPLYLYQNSSGRRSNIRQTFRKVIEPLYGKISDDESFLFYCYAVFYSQKYRKKYFDLLSKEFPRVPLTSDKSIYKLLRDFGEKLVRLHTLKTEPSDARKGTFPIAGSDLVEKIEFDAKNERVYINSKQYFGRIGSLVWNYYIGGYQVVEKYLKSRSGRRLSGTEMESIQRIVGIINETIALEGKIDSLYDKVKKNLFEYEEKPEQSPLFLDEE